MSGTHFFTTVLAPFLFLRILMIPSLVLMIPGVGPTWAIHALINLVLADMLTNIHSFITIATNHAGEDLYTFHDAIKPKTFSFYVRQIVGSTNFAGGSNLLDFAHCFLNYQIEHHIWPDMSMQQYQIAAPQLCAICDKDSVLYVQESVWVRFCKMVDIMVGKTTMRAFPVQYKPAQDKAGNKGVTWKAMHGAIDE